MEVVPSTRHQKLKFPLENENGRVEMITVRGDQHMAKQCLRAVLPGEAESSQVHMAELDREAELEALGRALTQKSIKDLTEIRIDPSDPNRYFLLGSQLPKPDKTEPLNFLLQNKEVFAWTPYEMPGISPEVMCHKLNVDPKHKPVI